MTPPGNRGWRRRLSAVGALLPRMSGPRQGRGIQAVGAALAGAALALGLWAGGVLDPWEWRTWDWRVRFLAEKGPATDDIRMILLDGASLEWGRRENAWSWPWPREVYAAIVDHCRRQGVRAVALDILFTEPSVYGVADDEALGRAIAAAGNVALAVFPSPKETPSAAAPPGDGKTNPSSPARFTPPIPEVAAGAALLCDVHLEPDPDGVYRRIPLSPPVDRDSPPGFASGLWRIGHPGKSIPVMDGVADASGRAILHYRGPAGTHPAYTAAAVIQSELRVLSGEEPVIPADAFRDKYVIVGFSAPGLYDLRPAPVGGVYTGAEVHATVLDNLLSGDFMRPVPAGITALAVLLMAGLCALVVGAGDGILILALAGLVLPLIPLVSGILAYRAGWWLPVVPGLAAVLFTALLGLTLRYLTEGRQKRFIQSAFSQYLSPDVVLQLVTHPERLELGGEKRRITIFFSDLADFTSISERLNPDRLMLLMNIILSAITEAILAENGTVDKYIGDAVVALWNAPLDVPNHAVRAVRAALAAQAKLARLAPDIRENFGYDPVLRIGINTGDAVVGNFGSRMKFNYTMMGDAVNLASRLEGVNKEFGTRILISEATRREMGDAIPVREIGRVVVKGRKQSVNIHEPLSPEAVENGDAEDFATGLALFTEGRFIEAASFFDRAAAKDPAAAAYANRCHWYLEVPPMDWNGEWVMTTK